MPYGYFVLFFLDLMVAALAQLVSYLDLYRIPYMIIVLLYPMNIIVRKLNRLQ